MNLYLDAVQDAVTSPQSITLTQNDRGVIRSRTWSKDIPKSWNVPITELETLDDRAKRYKLYFVITAEQLQAIHSNLEKEIHSALKAHRKSPLSSWRLATCALHVADTFVTESMLPNGKETGTAVSLEFGGTDTCLATAVNIQAANGAAVPQTTQSCALTEFLPQLPKGLLDRNATASQLFDRLAMLVNGVLTSDSAGTRNSSVVLGSSFPITQLSPKSACLITWTRGVETGRSTFDEVEKRDLGALLQKAFERNSVKADVVAVIPDSVAVLLSGCFNHKIDTPKCRVGIFASSGVNGCFVDPEPTQPNCSEGCVVKCDLGSFNNFLPINDVDLEVDFAEEATMGKQLFEKMSGTAYLGEICRRLIVKVWQSNAPALAWVRHSLPWTACAAIIADMSENRNAVQQLLSGFWEWTLPLEQLFFVQDLFSCVFDRSAALIAASLVALCSSTGRLQLAMGGVTCAMSGCLYTQWPFYRQAVTRHVSTLLGEDRSKLINFEIVPHGVAQGCALLSLKMAKP